MRVRIYIAGPMTGYENFNREAFHRAEDALKREGHTVLNPAVLPDGLTQPHYMDICMAMLRCVDAVYMLKGWQGNDSNLLIVFYVQIMPDDFVMQLHR
ncbi:DUF4406 domain-containing protein, partial [Escherichia coli]